MTNAWIEHVRKVQREKGISYSEALKVGSKTYNKKPAKTRRRRVQRGTGTNNYLARQRMKAIKKNYGVQKGTGVRSFVKRHRKKIAGVLGAAGAVGALALAGNTAYRAHRYNRIGNQLGMRPSDYGFQNIDSVHMM